MKKMKSLIKQDQLLLFYGCSADCLDLLEQILAPQTIIKPIANSKNSHLPEDTHRNSQIICLDTDI